MTLVDASSFIDPSPEYLPSPGLAQPPPYAASPSPTCNPVTESEMSEEAETTSVVHHLQTDSVNTDCDLLLDMAGGMMMSPPRPGMNFSGEEDLFLKPDFLGDMAGGMMMSPPRPGINFSGEEALFHRPDFHTDMGGGMSMSMSPPRMNYFSPPSGDSIGNSHPFTLCNFADQELENMKGMMMRPTWKQPCIEEVDAGSGSASGLGQNQSLGIWAATLEARNMGGTMQQSCWYTKIDLFPKLQYLQMFQCRLLVEIVSPHSLEEVGTASEENHTAHICPALEAQYNAAGRGGMLLQQDSSSVAHIPESRATNEERNNVFELKSIDAEGGSSSSEKTDTISRCRWEKDHGITRNLLQQLFGKSRDDAAKTLKVSTSTFKRACRGFGINRWPNHKGKRPKCSLNQKQHVQAVKKHKEIQPCLALPPLQPTNTSQCNSTMSVKVTYKNDTIRFPLSSSSTMTYLEEQLETKFKISLDNFCIKYQDEEDEWITLTCDSELLHGLDVLRSCGKTVIRMMVTPKFN